MQQRMVDIDAVLPDATKRIVREVNPLAIILFGSHARGDAKPHSDIDLLIVVRKPSDEDAARRTAHDALKGFWFGSDVVVATPEKIRRFGTMVGLVFLPALREGRVLYEAGEWDTRCEVREAEVEIQVREWVQKARRDLRAAHRALEDDDWGNAAYHAQQTVEKAIKAILIYVQVEFTYTHEIEKLIPSIPADWEARHVLWHPDLNKWALGGRYPSAGIEPGEEDAKIAIRNGTEMLDAAREGLTARGFDFEG